METRKKVKKYKKNDQYMHIIRSTPNYEEMNIEQLYELCEYPKTLQGFRNLLWRENIKCNTRVPRGQAKLIIDIKESGEDLSNLTLQEIKDKFGYIGTIDSLKNLLKKSNTAFKNTYSEDQKRALDNKDLILEKIRALGDTNNMRPNQIMEAIGFDIEAPGPFLKRFNIPYLAMKRGQR